MNTIVACFFVALTVAVLGQPHGSTQCNDKDCHLKCAQAAEYSVGLCVNEICECIPINTSQQVIEQNIHGSIFGDLIDAITGDCNMISCMVNCVKKRTFGGCLFGICQCI